MIELTRCEAERMRRAHEVDERMAVLVTQKNKVVGEMVLLVHEIERDELFRSLGATSVTDYMRRRAGWEPSKTAKVVALARNVEQLPRLCEALVEGRVPWTKAYLASELATPETDAHWVEKAVSLTKDQLEAELARACGGEAVARVTLNLTPAQLAAIDLAVAAVRSESTEELSWAEAVAEACQRMLEGGGAGSSKFRIHVHVCADCGRATREGKNGPVEICPSDLETMACNAEHVDVREGSAPLSRSIPPRIENYVRARDRDRCRVPGCPNRARVHLHHEGGWQNVGHDPLSVYVICVSHHRAIHKGHIVVRTLAPGRFEFLRRDRVSLGQLDLNLPAEGPMIAREERPRAEARTDGRAEETFPGEGLQAQVLATESHTAGSMAQETAIAVAALRKLEFRAAEARELVARAIRSLPMEHRTASEVVGAALRLVE